MSAVPAFDASHLILDVEVLKADIRKMEAAIDLHRRREDLRASLAALGIKYEEKPLTMAEMVATVARHHRLQPEQMLQKFGPAEISRARQEAMWLLRQQHRADETHRWSLPQIARYFGLDHTTVIHGIRAHAARAAR